MADEQTRIPQEEQEAERMRQAQEQGTDTDSPPQGTKSGERDKLGKTDEGIGPDDPEKLVNAGEM